MVDGLHNIRFLSWIGCFSPLIQKMGLKVLKKQYQTNAQMSCKTVYRLPSTVFFILLPRSQAPFSTLKSENLL